MDNPSRNRAWDRFKTAANAQNNRFLVILVNIALEAVFERQCRPLLAADCICGMCQDSRTISCPSGPAYGGFWIIFRRGFSPPLNVEALPFCVLRPPRMSPSSSPTSRTKCAAKAQLEGAEARPRSAKILLSNLSCGCQDLRP